MPCASSTSQRQAGGDSALVVKYTQLIDRCARRLARRSGSNLADELWSAGALGLLDAARSFDPGKNVRFESFAEHRIRGAMLDEMRRMDHLPRRLRARTDLVAKARMRLGHRLGREPTSEELAAEAGIELDTLGELEILSRPHLSLAQSLPNASEEPPPDEQAARAQFQRALVAAVGRLPQRLQLLLSLHYVEGLTYREIGKVLQVSEPRVCQLHAEAVARMRQELAEPEAPERLRRVAGA